MNTPTHTAQELADRFGLQVHGDPSTAIHGVATLAHAGPGQLTFLANPRYRAQLADSRASIVVLRADDAEAAPGTALIAKDPYTTFAKISALFETAPLREAGKVSRARYVALADAVKAILAHAIARGGTTLRDFISPDGAPGYFEQELLVYGRGGEPCPRCGRTLKQAPIGQRASVWCGHCQR